jgi:nicotinamidase-related amidase
MRFAWPRSNSGHERVPRAATAKRGVFGRRPEAKPRYSAFDHTPLALLLEELDRERVVLVGLTTEGCIAQSAIDARELGYKVSVVPAACGQPTHSSSTWRFSTSARSSASTN